MRGSKVSILGLAIVIVVMSLSAGCWFQDKKNPVGPQGVLEPPRKEVGTVPNLGFKIVFPPSEVKANQPLARILAGVNSTPTVTITLSLVNVGEASNTTTVFAKTFPVGPDGWATATFQMVPAKTAIGDIHIDGGHIGGYSDFHGAIDLVADVDNTCEVSPKESKTIQDVTAVVVKKVVEAPHFYSKVAEGLASDVRGVASSLELSSTDIYDDAITAFINTTIVQIGTVLGPNTISLSEPSLLSLTEFRNGGTQLVFSNPPTQIRSLTPGTIMVGSYTEIASAGVFRKIDSVANDGLNWTFTTSQATLEEAFQELTVEYYGDLNRIQLSPSIRRVKAFIAEGSIGGKITYHDDIPLGSALTLDADIKASAKLYFKLEIKAFQIREFVSTFDVDEKASLVVSSNDLLSVDINDGTPRSLLAVLQAGPLTIPIYWRIAYRASGSVNPGLRIGAEQYFNSSVGARYYLGNWEKVETYNWGFNRIFEFEPQANFQFSAGPKLEAMIYGLGGPTLGVMGNAYLDILPQQRLSANASVELAAKIEVSNLLKLEKTFTPWASEKKILWEKTTVQGTPPTVSIISPSNSASFAEGMDIQVRVHAVDPDVGGGIVKVELYRGNTFLQSDLTYPYYFSLPSPAPGALELWVRATDKAGDKTDSASITVNILGALPTVPVITQVSPNPVIGSTELQTLTITGNNFQSGAKVRFLEPVFHIDVTKDTTFVSITQLTVPARFGRDPTHWTIQVKNPSGTNFSSPYGFDVVAPPLPPTGGFDYPFGNPDGTPRGSGAWRCDQDYNVINTDLAVPKYHLGEDWNFGAGSDDLGLPIFSIGDGEVILAQNYGTTGTWQGVVMIKHSGTDMVTPDGTKVPQIVSLYGHLDASKINDWVQVGSIVKRGDQIGVIGPTPTGSTGPHLHFEIRTDPTAGVGGGYSSYSNQPGWVDPSDFIEQKRPASLVTPKVLQGLSLSTNSTKVFGGSTFDLSGVTVTANFTDSTNSVITASVTWSKISGGGNLSNKLFTAGSQPGTTLLRGFYSDGTLTKFADFTVTTQGDSNFPIVTAVSPSDSAKNVAINTQITISFSEPMDVSTINSTNISLTLSNGMNPVSGLITPLPDGTGAVFSPSSPLGYFIDYRVLVTNGVRDAGGTPMGLNFTSTFTTVPAPITVNTDKKICGGDKHGVAIKRDGTVWAWGFNGDGQIGDGTYTTRRLPVQIPSLTGAKSLAAGYGHTLALMPDGTVYSWGANGAGQLGDGTTTKNPTPRAIPGLTGIVGIAARMDRSLALTNTQVVYSWGSGGGPSPVLVPGLGGIVEIAAGSGHAAALTGSGTVMTWGANGFGQLGNGTLTDSPTPVQVSGLTDAVAIAAGNDHCLALRQTGGVVAWGQGYDGELGFGNYRSSLIVYPEGLSSGIGAIGAGTFQSFAIKTDGTVMAWGTGGGGELGIGNMVPQFTPVPITGFNDVREIVGGHGSSLARKSNGTVWTWGNNSFYQLGDGGGGNRPFPLDVPLTIGPVGVNSVAGDRLVTFSWRNVVGATGYNLYWSTTSGFPKAEGTKIADIVSPYVHRNLGNGMAYSYVLTAIKPEGEAPCELLTRTPQGEPNAPPTVSLVMPGEGQRFNPGSNILMAANVGDSDGTVAKVEYYEGANKVAEAIFSPFPTTWYNVPAGNYSLTAKAIDNLGDFTISNPVSISVAPPTAIEVAAVAGGGEHSMALQNDGSLWTWGAGSAGQLGDGTNTPYRTTPYKISSSGFIQVVGGQYFTLARKNDGTVSSWGANSAGYLGDGTTTNQNVPKQVLFDIDFLAAGKTSSLGVKTNGTVLGWGNNESGFLLGQVSDPAIVSTPTIIQGLPLIASAAVGDLHFLALDRQGYVWAWGNGYQGQLGDGGPLETLTGVQVPAKITNLSNIVSIGAGYNNSYALDGSGFVWTWGNNQNGQLGDGTTVNNSIPRKVPGAEGVVAIAGGQGHILALKGDGTLIGWGQNGAGQVGNGAITNCLTPVSLGLTNVVFIGAGRNHSLAITSDKKVWTWGGNSSGQLGNNSTTSSPSPVEVSF